MERGWKRTNDLRQHGPPSLSKLAISKGRNLTLIYFGESALNSLEQHISQLGVL